MKHSQRLGWRTLLVMIALAALSLTLFTGCARSGGKGGSAEAPPEGAVMVTAADADQTVRVTPGQMLEVVLDANPSTGYTWTIVSAPEFLQAEGEPGFRSEAASDIVGAGGKQTLEFSVTASGDGALELSYVRPWEQGVAPADTFRIEVESE